MLRDLANEDVPWQAVRVFQVDERLAPAGDPDRNLTHLRASLLENAPLEEEQIHAMPVEASDLEIASRRYAQTLCEIAGSPPVLDLVHLGLGPDGHTASLVPGDPVLNVADAAVGLTGSYMGRRRMTLTYPVINRARRILWLVTGAEKVEMLKRLRNSDTSIPAGRVALQNALVLADRAAAGQSAAIKADGVATKQASQPASIVCQCSRDSSGGSKHACWDCYRSWWISFEDGVCR
jgi:6-phosphogluconolactonase